MFKHVNQPVHSEYRYYQSPFTSQNGQWFNPYILKDHLTSASHQQSTKPFANTFNRPHLNIKLDDKYRVRALVKSGSSVSLGDSSLIQHLKKQFPIAPPVNVTDCHNAKKPTLGCYGAMLSVEDPLPYPLLNKPVNIHMTENLSSELILGTDFLRDHGAIVSMRSNNVIFLPDKYFAVSLNQKPIVCKAFSSVIDNDLEIEDLANYNMATFAVQPVEDTEILYMDQKTIHVQIIANNHTMIHKPGTTIMLTSGFAPQPQIRDGLYSIDHNNTIRVTIKNSSTGSLSLRQNRPIPGIVAHDLELGYHEPVAITKETLRALFLKDQTVKAAKLAGVMPSIASSSASTLAKDHPYYSTPTPEEYISSVQDQFNQASSLFQASGLDPPGTKTKPKQAPSLAKRSNLQSQFDASGIEKE